MILWNEPSPPSPYLVITSLPVPAADRYCPEGFEYSFERCYLFSEAEDTWTGAEKECEKQHAKLASVTTWSENDFVYHENFPNLNYAFILTILSLNVFAALAF